MEFRGRLSNACFIEVDGRRELPLTPVDVYEVLDELPDVAASERFLDIRQVTDHTAAGSLRFALVSQLVDRKVELTLTVELRYSPHLYPERVAGLGAYVRTRLLERSRLLARRVADGQVLLRVDFRPSGSVQPFALKV